MPSWQAWISGDTPPAVRGLQPSPACTAVASHPGVWVPTPLVQFHVQPKASASKKSAVWAWNPCCYSRWEDHSLHLCSKTVHAGCPRTRLLSDPILVTDASRQKEAVRSDRWRLWVLHPIHYAQAKQAWHSGPIDRYLFRSPSSHRPHVSLSGALPPAFASWGILPSWACGGYLLGHPESTRMVIPFRSFVFRGRRIALSAGFSGGEHQSLR